ncbi:hypothetical protein LB559_09030 [Mesorhizobium sp. BR1-1-3]|uniref:hypothetical protein n=1 Tax=Mesorhizobium sp. BR1-1-3 TaxID=2876651 RepID=UPI001CD15345|nr:hypothetical protein [Mesorhizobium sp. BR1-1-3]MBZ9888081.1 hypothetical protein [Mesorhizobium sp. BR1-1-3]
MKIGYADPPYVGCAHLYKDHPDFAGEVDHAALIDRLQGDYDGWVLHASATAKSMAVLAPLVEKTGARWMSWVKGFAAFKRNVSVAYAWEPVIVKAARKPVVSKRLVMRDWIQESITLRKGLTGAKPEAVCHWAFEMVGARPDDMLDDMFPGTGAVSEAWRTWQLKFALFPTMARFSKVRHDPHIPTRYQGRDRGDGRGIQACVRRLFRKGDERSSVSANRRYRAACNEICARSRPRFPIATPSRGGGGRSLPDLQGAIEVRRPVFNRYRAWHLSCSVS